MQRKKLYFCLSQEQRANVCDMKQPTQLQATNESTTYMFSLKIAESHIITPLLAKEAVHHCTHF